MTDDERNALVVRCLPIVQRVARRIVGRLPASVELDDLVSIGLIALVEAVDRYEEDRAASFEGYVKIRVRGAILDELRRIDLVPRSVRDLSERAEEARATLTRELGRAPTAEELAARLGTHTARLHAIRADLASAREVPLEEEDADGATRLPDSPLTVLELAHDAARLRGAIERLPPRERMVAELYYFREQSLKEIGATMHITESRVCQLHTRLKERLREALAAEDEAVRAGRAASAPLSAPG